jgi:hypothetical protein
MLKRSLISGQSLSLGFSHWDLLQEFLIVFICFERLHLGRVPRHVKITPLTSHAMLTLRPVWVSAITVPKMDILVGLAFACGSALDRSTIEQHLDHGNVAFEIACVHIGLRQFVRRNGGIPLRGLETSGCVACSQRPVTRRR